MRLLLSVTTAAVALAALVVPSSHAHSQSEEIPPNRCLPGQSCFPSRQAVREFASTLNGKVYWPYDAEYSALVRQSNGRLTRHPALVVVAESVDDVRRSVRFAREYLLMITSQSGNDDPSERSSYDGSLNINLSRLEAILANPANTSRSEFGEIKVGPGAVWEDVYTQARSFGRDVVAPSDIKSAVGDSVGDGAVGPLARLYGLVEDNMLEFEMVMADGSLVVVNEYNVQQNFEGVLTSKKYDRHLFAAVAGGGRGVWGLVTSFTFKMIQAPASVVHARFVYNLYEGGDMVGREVLEGVINALPALPERWGGYVYMQGDTSTLTPDTKGTLVLDLLYYGTWKQESGFDYYENIRQLDSQLSLREDRVINRTSLLEHQQSLADDAHPGPRSFGFSSLLVVNGSVNEPQRLTEALLFTLNNPTIDSTYTCTAELLGGAVATSPHIVTYVNPQLRNAAASLRCTLAYQDAIDDSFYMAHALDFRQLLAPFGQGRHRHWGPDGERWKAAFHGEHYKDLISAKLRYDVDNYLWCHNCVGSDFRIACPRRQRPGQGPVLSGWVSRMRVAERKSRERANRQRARKVYITQVGRRWA